MKYWPMSVVASSPLLPWHYQGELFAVQNRHYDVMSQAAVVACVDVINHTQPVEMPNLAVLESVGTNPRRVFKDYPTDDEWERLERTGIVLDPYNCAHVILDALH